MLWVWKSKNKRIMTDGKRRRKAILKIMERKEKEKQLFIS
jgi:hypothetical protein